MLQLDELCRLCAQKKKNKFDLFSETNNEENKIFLEKISLCLSVKVTREDLLPKMICTDCQRTVDQFNAFRIKCHKAEEKLNKMLSLIHPSKLTVTRIKQEYVEMDVHDSSNQQLPLPSPISSELVSFTNFKSEVDEIGNGVEWNHNSSTDLIQIISEEVVYQQNLVDVKQPLIEIISENFTEELKNDDETECDNFCDVKIMPENLFRIENSDPRLQQSNSNWQSEEIAVKETESDEELNFKLKTSQNKKIKRSKQNDEDKWDDIDEKYLTLKEGEVCDIDVEEMDALIKKKENPNMVFKCDKCDKSFKFFKRLRKHKHWHDSQPKMYVCEFCKDNNFSKFEFSCLKTLNNHIQKKHTSNDQKFLCSLCKIKFSSKGQFNSHYKNFHETVTCRICGKVFKNVSRLKHHLKVHQDDRPYVCDQCGESFKWSNALKIHTQWHKQEKNFLCSECGKKFTAKKNLIEHLNIHTGKRPYCCEKCNASFAQMSAYSKHLALHNEGRKPHKCDKCIRSFSHPYMLKNHLVTHTSLRPYKCPTCHRTFKTQSDLCSHVKIHQEKQYGCQYCGKKFAVSKTLKDHLVRHTGIKHKCPISSCGKTYTQRFSLTKHFCKKHPAFSIVKKKGGNRSHMNDKVEEKNETGAGFIRYEFTEKKMGNLEV